MSEKRENSDGGKNPKVSIIIPVYNMEKFLPDAVNSALKQSFQDFEIIIVDDGSTDKTPDIAKRLAANDSRIRYFRRKHSNQASARNFAIRNSNGEYLAMLDADDIWEKGHLKDSIGFLDKNRDAALVFSMMDVFADNPGSAGQSRDEEKKQEYYDDAISRFIRSAKGKKNGICLKFGKPSFVSLMRCYCIPNSSMVIGKHVAIDAGMYNESLFYGEDSELAFRISRNYAMGFIPRKDVGYRIHKSNCHSSVEGSRCTEMWGFIEKYGSLTDEERKEIRRRKADAFKYAGYGYFAKNRFSKASHYFVAALNAQLNYFSLKYLAIMFLLPNSFLKFYRKRANARLEKMTAGECQGGKPDE